MTWSKPLEDAIDLGNGKSLRTLADAIAWLADRPKTHHVRPEVQLAAKLVTDAAERGGITLLAQIAVAKVVNHGKPAPKINRRKRAKKYRLVR